MPKNIIIKGQAYRKDLIIIACRGYNKERVGHDEAKGEDIYKESFFIQIYMDRIVDGSLLTIPFTYDKEDQRDLDLEMIIKELEDE